MIEPADDGHEEVDEVLLILPTPIYIIIIIRHKSGNLTPEQWYRKQHLDMLSMIEGYRRSTRYQSVGEKPSGTVRFLACHEFDLTTIPVDKIKLTIGTEWSKKILGSVKSFERESWEELAAAGAVDEKL
jgi:hypothetical protein